ncbi:MAG: hypothetical protein EBR51_10935, partial [Gammaproteobacteria bacterium]|nr:hypothetical protein [Gammaproteobacteria bacterium]
MDLFQFQRVFGDLTNNANGSMFGEHVAVSADGDTVVIGIPGDTGVEPKIRTFRRTGDAWAPLATDLTFANASSDEPKSYLFNLSADGSRLLVHRRNGDRAVMLANMVSDAWVVDGDFYINNIVACVLSADGAQLTDFPVIFHDPNQQGGGGSNGGGNFPMTLQELQGSWDVDFGTNPSPYTASKIRLETGFDNMGR